MKIDHLDHLVLTVADIDRTCAFYTQVLGMERVAFQGGRIALRFGRQKINLHQVGRERELRAQHAAAGSGDLCFITAVPVEEVVRHIEACGEKVLVPPSQRSGATGPIRSVYLRDPDGNLVEISNLIGDHAARQ